MKIYKDGQLYFESTDPASLEAMIESISNSLYNNHYTKSETMSLIASSRSVVQVATMPASPARNTLYYVGSSSPYNVKLVDSNGIIVDMGSSEVDLTDYVKKTDIATSFSTSSTNDKVAGALASFNSFAPKQSGTYVGQFIVPNNCIVPFGFTRQLNMANERATINGIFVSQMTDPVDGSSNLFGALKVTQQCYGGSAGGTATNIVIEQTFETFLRGTPTVRKVFFRRGYVANSATDININDTTAIASAITWMAWYPIEYPRTNVSLKSGITGISSFSVCYSVTGGNLALCVRNITLTEQPGNVYIAELPNLPVSGKVDGGMVSTLTPLSADKCGAIQLFSQNSRIEMFIYGLEIGTRYLSSLILPLGY